MTSLCEEQEVDYCEDDSDDYNNIECEDDSNHVYDDMLISFNNKTLSSNPSHPLHASSMFGKSNYSNLHQLPLSANIISANITTSNLSSHTRPSANHTTNKSQLGYHGELNYGGDYQDTAQGTVDKHSVGGVTEGSLCIGGGTEGSLCTGGDKQTGGCMGLVYDGEVDGGWASVSQGGGGNVDGSVGGERKLDVVQSVDIEQKERVCDVNSLLRQRVKGLETENSIIVTNMSCLYLTAKKEIEIKDRRISSLKSEVESLRAMHKQLLISAGNYGTTGSNIVCPTQQHRYRPYYTTGSSTTQHSQPGLYNQTTEAITASIDCLSNSTTTASYTAASVSSSDTTAAGPSPTPYMPTAYNPSLHHQLNNCHTSLQLTYPPVQSTAHNTPQQAVVQSTAQHTVSTNVVGEHQQHQGSRDRGRRPQRRWEGQCRRGSDSGRVRKGFEQQEDLRERRGECGEKRRGECIREGQQRGAESGKRIQRDDRLFVEGGEENNRKTCWR
eukprot:GHVQ01042504.1.p1 GENE.GHVQ01042504.1~~GHVQ01042504.1.p1  ORF type:complete len:498 (-),score=130.44 GHVQ01042504.1:837-2330(-)